MPALLPWERILALGITGSGKSYQWLKLAEKLKPSGAIFRVIDTDNDIDYMLQTQFPHLLPQNGGNVLVKAATEWEEMMEAIKWLKAETIKPIDWVIVDKVNRPWSCVSDYFVTEVFKKDIGEYFLDIRKRMADHEERSKNLSLIHI